MIVMQNGKQIAGGGLGIFRMTRAEYNANKDAYDASDFLYDITDEEPSDIDAGDIIFNNSDSSLSSNKVEGAIKELDQRTSVYKTIYSGTKVLTSQQSGTLTTSGDYIEMTESIENFDALLIEATNNSAPYATRLIDVDSIKKRYGSSFLEITEIVMNNSTAQNSYWSSRISLGFIDSTKLAIGWYGNNQWNPITRIAKVVGIKL